MGTVYIKDPDSVIDHSWDFNDWLNEGDSIDTHEVTTVAGNIVVDSTSEADGVVTAILSGGTAYTRARVRYRITTTAGLGTDRTKHFYITQR